MYEYYRHSNKSLGLNSLKQAALNDGYIFLAACEVTGVISRHNLRRRYLDLLIKHHASSSFLSFFFPLNVSRLLYIMSTIFFLLFYWYNWSLCDDGGCHTQQCLH